MGKGSISSNASSSHEQMQIPPNPDSLYEDRKKMIDNQVDEAKKEVKLNSQGEFIDCDLEAKYQNYVKRKQKSGKTIRDRLDWKEVRDYWLNDSPMARGNAFNKSIIKQGWYMYHEIHLAENYRLDSYDPAEKEIISRKATDLEDIEFATFEIYLKEMKKKYAPGKVIRSNKYSELDGLQLEGQMILEIPDTNKEFNEIDEYVNFAKEKYNITIRFRSEA